MQTETDQAIDTATSPEIPVTLDPTFSRHVADNALVFYMGRDLEISFIQVGPNIAGFRPAPDDVEDAHSSYTIGAKQTEVARIRCSPSTAIQLAMTIIDDLMEAGTLKVPNLMANIEKMVQRNRPDSTNES